MTLTINDITKLIEQLYPDGRAYKFIPEGYRQRFHRAMGQSLLRAYFDALNVIDAQLPDNPNFTDDDATVWENRLGIYRPYPIPLADRMKAIARKLNHPGTVRPRMSRAYLEWSLQQAGFNVYVYENRFSYATHAGYYTKTPGEFANNGHRRSVSGYFQSGENQSGEMGSAVTKLANHIDETLDQGFNVGSNYRSTFFVGGATAGTFADVDVARKDEFRQLILQLKPLQMCGFLLINYV